MSNAVAKAVQNPSFHGKQACYRLPELLIQARAQRFDGSLILKTENGRRAAILFRRGTPVRAHTPAAEHLAWEVLGQQLPQEQLALAEQHARHQKVDSFIAIKQLVLLPDVSLARLHGEWLSRQLERICRVPGLLSYRFFAGRDCFDSRPGLNSAVEPLSLIVECLMQSSSLDWCRDQLVESRHQPLVLVDNLGGLDCELRGVLRQVVLTLRRHADSFEQLRLKRVAPEGALVAVVFALRATGCVSSPTPMPVPDSPAVSGVAPRLSPTSLEAVKISTSPRARSARTTEIPTVVDGRATIANSPVTQEHLRRIRAQRSGSVAPQSAVRVRRAESKGGQPEPPPPIVHPKPSQAASRAQALPPKRSIAPRVSTTATTQRMPAVTPSESPSKLDEHAVEGSCLQAWMRAVDEPGCRVRALEVTQRAVRHFPRNPRMLFYLGCIQALNGNNSQAKGVLLRVLQLDPEYLEAKRELRRLGAASQPQPAARPSLLARLVGER